MSSSLATPPLAALTTIFTPPCPTSWLVTTTVLPSQNPDFPGPAPAPSASCDPPRWADNLKDLGFQYYSPAICPQGFEVGPSCDVVEPRTDEGFQAIQPGETAAYCVPSGHTCTSDTTDFRGGVWGQFVPSASSSFAATAAAAAAVTVGPAIQIRWKENDFASLETHPLTPGMILAGAAPTAPSPVASPTAVSPSSAPPARPTTTSSVQPSSPEATDTTSSEKPSSPTMSPSVTTTESSIQSSLKTSPSTTTSQVEGSSSSSSSTVVKPTITPPSSEAVPPSGLGRSKTGLTVNGSSNSGMDPKILAAIVLSTLLFATMMAALGFLLIRRYRQQQRHRRHGCGSTVPAEFHPSPLPEAVVGNSPRVVGSCDEKALLPPLPIPITRKASSSSTTTTVSPVTMMMMMRDSEKEGGQGQGQGFFSSSLPAQELEPAYPSGTIGYCHELDSREISRPTTNHNNNNNKKWSWVSRVSTVLSVRRGSRMLSRHFSTNFSSSRYSTRDQSPPPLPTRNNSVATRQGSRGEIGGGGGGVTKPPESLSRLSRPFIDDSQIGPVI